MSFREQWREAVGRKNSVLCAGLDPADFDMARGDKGLPSNTHKLDWALAYVEAVAPHCAAIKPNTQYWKGVHDAYDLSVVVRRAKDLGLVVIEDSKLSDIGDTNEAGIHYAAQRADAVTIAPYAGNMEQTAKMAHAKNIGVITMCLMSNKEYEDEKNNLVYVRDRAIDPQDIISLTPDGLFTRRYIQLAHDARVFGLDGIVIGAPSKDNHITDHEIHRVSQYVGPDMLILCPGVGAQGGEATALWQHFGSNQVILNVGRGLMIPKTGTQAEAAEQYKTMLNKSRGV